MNLILTFIIFQNFFKILKFILALSLFFPSARPIELLCRGTINNILLGGDGYWNQVAGTDLNLESKYIRVLGTWFHVCMTWSNEDRRTRVYLNGHLIGTSGVTERSELDRGGKMCLGNRAGAEKHSTLVFGADMFKLNIYNRVLTEEEIKNMAADMCSCEEEKLASIKVLSWADILQYSRSGDISDIDACGLVKAQRKLQNAEEKLAESLNKTSYLEGNLTKVLGRLNNSEEELTESKNRTRFLEVKLAKILRRLNNSEEDLTESRNKTSYLEEKLNEVLGTLLKKERNLEESGIARQQLKVKQGITF